MSDLYWIIVLGNLKALFSASSFVFGILLITCVVTLLVAYSEGYKEEIIKRNMKFTKILLLSFIFSLLPVMFIPSTKEMYLIYGVGGTMDYLKSNPTAKQLPDKCVKALDKWLDSTMDEEKKENKQ